MSETVQALSRWVDTSGTNQFRGREAMIWQRCMKVAEELGEVTEALIGWTGSNPRKGQTHTLADVEKELLDVALAALGAVEHLNSNDGSSMKRLAGHAQSVRTRAGV